MFLRSTCTQRR